MRSALDTLRTEARATVQPVPKTQSADTSASNVRTRVMVATALSAALVARLLFGRALGGRHGLEPFIGDRLPALDREPVRSLRKPFLRALERSQRDSPIVGETLVQFVVVQVRRLVGQVCVGRCRLIALARREPAEAVLDPLTLAGEQFAGAVGIHALERI